MLNKLAAAVLIASMAASAADARSAGVSAAHHKYWPRCAEGMVKMTCVCHASSSKQHQLCHAGRWCHTFAGVCTL